MTAIAHPQPRQDRPALAVGLMLTTFLCFASMDTSAKWLVGAALPPLQVAFVRYAVHFGWVLAIFLPTAGRGFARTANLPAQALRGLFLLMSTVFNFAALQYLPLTVTISIFFTSPLVVCLLSIPVLGERVGPRRLIAVLVGFLGVLVVVRPWGAEFHWAMLLSVAAMLSAASYFVMTRRLAGRDDNPSLQFYAAGMATLLLAPIGLWVWVWPETWLQWALMGFMGTIGMTGHSLLTLAHRFAQASTLAPIVYVQILYVSVLGWVVFGDVPTAWTALGAAIIVGSGLYVWLRERALGA